MLKLSEEEIDRLVEIAAAKRKRWMASPEYQREMEKHRARCAQRESMMTDAQRELITALKAVRAIRFSADWESAAFAAFLKKRSRSIGGLTVRRLIKLHREFLDSDQYQRDRKNMNLAAVMQRAHGPN